MGQGLEDRDVLKRKGVYGEQDPAVKSVTNRREELHEQIQVEPVGI